MVINKDSNAYTIIFATAMVVVVGGLLAFVSTALKPAQQDNVRNEKKQLILKAIGSEETSSISREDAGAKFQELVVERLILDYEGNIIEGTRLTNETAVDIKSLKDAFAVDLKKEYKKFVQPLTNKFEGDELKSELTKEKNIHYPLFVCKVEGERCFVIPVIGKGLWAGVWGYIGLKEDGRTICGAAFDHEKETPGLGAEISKDFFSDQFIEQTIVDEDGRYTAVKVVKPGNVLDRPYVDGISGGTFTSVGVDEMLVRTLEVYHKFFQNEEGKKLLK
jgi:Na+-transporting NADH:ubiquinone oxidoreductase subunit C